MWFFFSTISLLDTSGLHDSTSTTSRVKAKVPGSLIGARFMSTQTVRTAKQDKRGKAKIQKVTVHIYFSVSWYNSQPCILRISLFTLQLWWSLVLLIFLTKTNRLKGVFCTCLMELSWYDCWYFDINPESSFSESWFYINL